MRVQPLGASRAPSRRGPPRLARARRRRTRPAGRMRDAANRVLPSIRAETTAASLEKENDAVHKNNVAHPSARVYRRIRISKSAAVRSSSRSRPFVRRFFAVFQRVFLRKRIARFSEPTVFSYRSQFGFFL